jgi:uncharacterized protein YggU (UPF0235/DUF167 family)
MYIRVKVTPEARKEEIKRMDRKDYFEISVREKALHNMANNRVVELFSDYFSLPREKVKIINGHHSHTKLLSIDLENE